MYFFKVCRAITAAPISIKFGSVLDYGRGCLGLRKGNLQLLPGMS